MDERVRESKQQIENKECGGYKIMESAFRSGKKILIKSQIGVAVKQSAIIKSIRRNVKSSLKNLT